MSTIIDKAPGQHGAEMLTGEMGEEPPLTEHHEPSDERSLLAIVQRAIAEQTDENWALFHDCFCPNVRRWLRTHHHYDLALHWDSEENYIAMTFSRFWFSVSNHHIEFATLPAVLSYLRATLDAVLTDTIRFHIRARSREADLADADYLIEASSEDSYDSHSLCDCIQTLLADEQQKRLAYLLYYCGLKPREITRFCSKEFHNVQDIYRLNNTIVERLRRNRDRLRHLLG